MRIRCAICNKPVDRWATWADPATDTHVIRAFCHGDRDEMRVTAGFLYSLNRDERKRLQNSEGVAFATKRIAAQGTEARQGRDACGSVHYGPVAHGDAPSTPSLTETKEGSEHV